jgi:Holliday junction resolvase RusA-like endonuclease
MVRSDRWRQRPAVLRYFDFKDAINAEFKGTLEPVFKVVFFMPMPKSWSEKKRKEMLGKPHQQKPDIDNLAKAFMDALCVDDSYVYDIHAKKFWHDIGSIELTEYDDYANVPVMGINNEKQRPTKQDIRNNTNLSK